MIRVTIINDERIIKSVTNITGEGILMAWAQENEKSPGYAIFSESGELLEITDRDNVFELLVRASLNRMDLDGVITAYCYDTKCIADIEKDFQQTLKKCRRIDKSNIWKNYSWLRPISFFMKLMAPLL